MGEIFERPVSSTSLKEPAGEQRIAAPSGEIEIEHLHRYLLARELFRGLDVLDLVAGGSYGSALLAQSARSVVSVELSNGASAYSASVYRAPNLTHVPGDAHALPLADASMDAVVAFETIEHFHEQDRFIPEVKRVLRPGGRLILSFPVRDVYSPPGNGANPDHGRELSRRELEALLRSVFPHLQVLAQRPMIGCALVCDNPGELSPTITFERRGPTHFESSPCLPRSPHLVMVASQDPVSPVPNSVFIDTSEAATGIDNTAADAAALNQARKQFTQIDEAQQSASVAVAKPTELQEPAWARKEPVRARDGDMQSLENVAQIERLQIALERTREELAQTREINAHAVVNAAAVAQLQGELDRKAKDFNRICSERDALRVALRRRAPSVVVTGGTTTDSSDYNDLVAQFDALLQRSWKLKLVRMTSPSFRSFLRRLRKAR